ncbi:PfaB family protein [Photobacterium sanguinicancri]|uniref:PfaB family protein n=1 Tax=Photobacterium sanguinicancri TaxID=875932 RepID=UPI002480B405|nr:PfaB family protein [Photobacterium sanguinicancri]
MPLRIALLAQPRAGLSANLFPSSLATETIKLSDDLTATLNTAIQVVNQGKAVTLTSQSGLSVVLMAGLTAAQNRIHPHAYLSGFAASLPLAVEQSRRQSDDVSIEQTSTASTAVEQFSALYQLIDDIAARNQQPEYTQEGGDDCQYWFTEPNKARVASLTFNTENVAFNTKDQVSNTSLVLTQATGLKEAKPLLDSSRLFFIITGNTEAELSTKLAELSKRFVNPALNSSVLIELMHQNLVRFQAGSQAQFTIVLQGASVDAVLLEINALTKVLSRVITEKTDYKTPAGSYFSPAPDNQGKVAFVYPGVGTVYPGMLRDFYQYFPDLYARLEREGNLKEMLQADKIYAASNGNGNGNGKTGSQPQEMTLSELAIAGVGSSYILTQLLCESFSIKPDFALGYSKGEASMWASLGVWRNPHALIEMTQTSPIFTTAISGELTAVREVWQLGESEAITWNSFLVRSEPAAIEALLPQYPRAYLAIIQGDTCILAGCEQSCRDLLKQLGKRGIASNRVTAMHTTPAWSQHAQVTDFYNQPLCDELPHHIRFISAAELLPQNANQPVNLDRQSIATSIADTFCSTLDFTALIRAAREHGARLFIELGADRQTSTLIDKINRADKVTDSLAVATNAKGGDDIQTLLKCIAQLITQQVPLSISPLVDGLARQLVSSETQSTLHTQGEPV